MSTIYHTYTNHRAWESRHALKSSGHVPGNCSVPEMLATDWLLDRALMNQCTSHWWSTLNHAHNIAKLRNSHSFSRDIVSCGDSGVTWSSEFRLSAGEGFGPDCGKCRTSRAHMKSGEFGISCRPSTPGLLYFGLCHLDCHHGTQRLYRI